MHTPYRGVEYTCTSRTSGRTSLEVLLLYSRSSKKSWHSYVHRCIAEVGNLASPGSPAYYAYDLYESY